jgi:hypothetical protein
MKRRTVIGAATAAGAAVAAGLYRFTDLFVKHYPPTPYDDVLAALVDREEATRLGARVQNAPAANVLAARLRVLLKPNGLSGAVASDIAAGRLTEVEGWVVPESLVLLSALAAKV